jgi:hypothetical protein
MKSGIYMIFHKDTKKAYICSSTDVMRSKAQLFYRLRNGNFPNKELQEDFDRAPENPFKFQLLEECSEDQFFERKKYWLSFYSDNYNNEKYAFIKTTITEETKRKTGDSVRQSWKERKQDDA